ncbi:zinc ribbon domain-containing protein [Roseibium sp. HPY-6]|uniref:Zn-ribbon domain-containing OB-fold protein n=1 Tax=Roseibium sp. HPY-6 TaxID=3229852 RepID=UPI00338DBEDB
MKDLSQLDVPGPTKTPLTAPFWENAAEGKLTIQKCGSCGEHFFYPRPLCPNCWSSDVAWTEVRGSGRLKSFSQIWKPGHPGWLPVTPYLVGLVELDEGPTLLSHILVERNEAKIGDRLEFIPQNIGGQMLPCFKYPDNKEEPV